MHPSPHVPSQASITRGAGYLQRCHCPHLQGYLQSDCPVNVDNPYRSETDEKETIMNPEVEEFIESKMDAIVKEAIRENTFHHVVEMAREGINVNIIARVCGLSENKVRKMARKEGIIFARQCQSLDICSQTHAWNRCPWSQSTPHSRHIYRKGTLFYMHLLHKHFPFLHFTFPLLCMKLRIKDMARERTGNENKNDRKPRGIGCRHGHHGIQPWLRTDP